MLNSRDIKHLTPEAQEKCRAWLAACAAQGLNIKITQTLRDAEYQKSLYMKGRDAQGKRIGAVVTNCDGYNKQSAHQSGKAWDAVPMNAQNVIQWTDMPSFRKMAEIADGLGITAGFYFKNMHDYGHFEIK